MQFSNVLLLTIFTFLFFSCGNQESVKKSKDQQISETDKVKSEKIALTNTADSLTERIKELKEKKISLSENTAAAEAGIFSTIQKSELDHVIIGTNNLKEISQLFTDFGFSIKGGKKHKNGIINNFIEFGNNSEIELIEINNPSDQIAEEYNSLIKQKNYGLKLALRVKQIENLKNDFDKIKLPFTILAENYDYKTLTSDKINTELPLFFIQFKNKIQNTIISHKNEANRIKAVWISTKDIKKSAHELANFGFEAVGKYEIPTLNKKIVQFKNSHFEIILIESNKYEISGITISVKNIKVVKNILANVKGIDFIEQSVPDAKRIYLDPAQTKSIWIEFTDQLINK